MMLLSYEEIEQYALKLSASERQKLWHTLSTSFAPEATDEEAFYDVDIALLLSELSPDARMTGAEIVATRLTSGWQDMSITDSVGWLEDLKRRRKA